MVSTHLSQEGVPIGHGSTTRCHDPRSELGNSGNLWGGKNASGCCEARVGRVGVYPC